MKKTLFLITIFGLATSLVFSQDTAAAIVTDTVQAKMNATKLVKTQETGWAVGLNLVNTAGPGLEVAYKINNKFAVRLSGNYIDASSFNPAEIFFPNDLEVTSVAKLGKIGLIGEYSLTDFFSINAGVVYNMFEAATTMKAKDSVKLGDATFSPEEFGVVTIDLKPKGKIAPYLGVGFWRTIPNKKIGFKLDVGTFYQAAPVVELTANNFLSDTQNADNQKVLEEMASGFAFYPVVNMSIQFKIK